jgi:hypothetical protein
MTRAATGGRAKYEQEKGRLNTTPIRYSKGEYKYSQRPIVTAMSTASGG